MNTPLYLIILIAVHISSCFPFEELDLTRPSQKDQSEEQWSSKPKLIEIERFSDTDVEKICLDPNISIYIKQEDVIVDCNEFLSNQETANVVKRAADEDIGSGETPEEETKPEPAEEKEEDENVLVNTDNYDFREATSTTPFDETTITTTKRTTTQTTAVRRNTTATTKTTVGDVETSTMVEDEEEATIVEETEEEQTTSEKTNDDEEEHTTVKTTEESKTTIEEQKSEPDNNSTETPTNNQEKETEEAPTNQEDKSTQNKSQEETPTDERIEDETNSTDEDKITEDEPKESEDHGFHSKDPKKDAELMNGRKLHPPTHQEAKENTNDDSLEDKTKASTSGTSKAGSSKDTTILVCMFVAVVIVGALAFGYNFIKKRKQRAQDLDRVERGNVLKRSLQNLVKPEGEPEKKPLMGAPGKEVEMVDMKKAPLAENSENAMVDESVSKSS